MSSRASFLSVATIALLWTAAVGLRPAIADEAFHFELERSAPAADSLVTSPDEIRLWFTEGAQEDATSIRLLDAETELVETSDVVSSEDRMQHAVSLDQTLPEGVYTVAWRSMAADGHVIRDEFEFTVADHTGNDR